MRIALFADLHGNRPATEALARDLKAQRPDRVYCLGDLVGKGPSNVFTYEWSLAHANLVLGGNWDYALGNRVFAKTDAFYVDQLGPQRLETLRRLPREHELWLSGRRIRLFHGRPVMESLVMPHQPKELLEPFFRDKSGVSYDAVVYADAHRQALRTLDCGLLVNIGSVGNALGVALCCYALLEGREGTQAAPFEIRLRQIEYDREQAVADARGAHGLPRGDCYIRELLTGQYSR